jgi:hypothetical protein
MNKKLQSMYKSGGLLKALLKDPAQAKMAMQMLGKQAKAAEGMAVNKSKLGMPGTAVPGAKNTYGGGGAMKYRMGGKAMYANGGQNGPSNKKGKVPGRRNFEGQSYQGFGQNTAGGVDSDMAYSIVPTKQELGQAMEALGIGAQDMGSLNPIDVRKIVGYAQDLGAQNIGLDNQRGYAQYKRMQPFMDQGRVIGNSYRDATQMHMNPDAYGNTGRYMPFQSDTGVRDAEYDMYEAQFGSDEAAGLKALGALQKLVESQGGTFGISGYDNPYDVELVAPKLTAEEFGTIHNQDDDAVQIFGRRFTDRLQMNPNQNPRALSPGDKNRTLVDPYDRSSNFMNLPAEEQNEIIRQDRIRLGLPLTQRGM